MGAVGRVEAGKGKGGGDEMVEVKANEADINDL